MIFKYLPPACIVIKFVTCCTFLLFNTLTWTSVWIPYLFSLFFAFFRIITNALTFSGIVNLIGLTVLKKKKYWIFNIFTSCYLYLFLLIIEKHTFSFTIQSHLHFTCCATAIIFFSLKVNVSLYCRMVTCD